MTEIIIDRPPQKVVPFFLRFVAILILVTGVLGLLFYLIVTFYQITGRNFLYDFGYKGFDTQGLYLILTLNILLNMGLLISALQLLKLKKAGMYLFGITYLVFALLSFSIQEDNGWVTPVIGGVIFLIIFIFRKKMS